MGANHLQEFLARPSAVLVRVRAGQSLFFPAGWFHFVHTIADSVVMIAPLFLPTGWFHFVHNLIRARALTIGYNSLIL
eukprot:705854-Prorocentrum_minimum.AAC.1